MWLIASSTVFISTLSDGFSNNLALGVWRFEELELSLSWSVLDSER